MICPAGYCIDMGLLFVSLSLFLNFGNGVSTDDFLVILFWKYATYSDFTSSPLSGDLLKEDTHLVLPI